MKTIAIDQIKLGVRQREEFAPKQLEELKTSIRTNGLLHAPVITADGTLVVGERRLRAITALHQEGHSLTYDSQAIPTDHIPYTLLDEVDPAKLAEAEFAENIFRVDLSWPERTKALKRLYDLRQEQSPTTTFSSVARELEQTADIPFSTARQEIAKATIVAKHLDDPEVKRARSAEEAYKIILDRAEAKAVAAASKVALPTQNEHRLILGDCKEELKKIPSNYVSAIICDPPYGMNADKMGKGEFHMYDDSPEAALDVCKTIIREGFRVAKPKAILFMFCDLDHFISLRTYASQQAWTCWRKPILWRKGVDGHSPWGRAGFIYTYEALLFAVKGQKELLYPGGPDIIDFKRPGRNERVHSAEKPISLLRHLIKLSCLPGETILDPTAGSGPIISAATAEKVKAIIIEKEENYFNECINRLSQTASETDLSEDQSATRASGLSTPEVDLLAD